MLESFNIVICFAFASEIVTGDGIYSNCCLVIVSSHDFVDDFTCVRLELEQKSVSNRYAFYIMGFTSKSLPTKTTLFPLISTYLIVKNWIRIVAFV